MADAEDLYMDGLAKMGEGDFDAAVAEFEKARALEPDNLDVLLGLSMAHSKNEDYDTAIAVAREAAEKHPDDPFPHTNLSMFLMRQGKKEEAEDESALATKLQMKQ